ncbi:MAG: LacI family DNA-binding transcriptional regulator, partial [Planctomycetota bacterium]
MDSSQITIQDIAERASVSKATVSRVINNSSKVLPAKRKAVTKAMRELGYEPNSVARSLAGGKSMTIGVLTQNFGSPYYDAISQGIISGMKATGYSPIFADGRWDQEAGVGSIRTLIGRRIDGLIVVGGEVAIEDLNSVREKLPTIVVGRELVGWEGQCMHIDNVKGGYEATKHLIDFGHRRIAIIRGIQNHSDAIQRFEGYLKAIEDAGIECDNDLIYQGDFSAQAGVMAVNSLIARGVHFSAIVAANDMVAFGARLALHRRGIRVPEDASIVGFDDQAEAQFMTPPLTTIHQPAVEMGVAASEALIKLILDEPYELPQLSADLRQRESVSRKY